MNNKEIIYSFARAVVTSPLIKEKLKGVALSHQIPEKLAEPIADIIIDKLRSAFKVWGGV